MTSVNTERTFKMDAETVAGVTFDGETVWASLFTGDQGSLARIDRKSGKVLSRVPTASVSGLAWDGKNLWGCSREGILCLDPETLQIVRTLPRPNVPGFLSGLAFDGEALWAGDYNGKKLLKIDRETGAVLKTVASDRFVTGITWANDQLWHATSTDEGMAEEKAELRCIDPDSGEILENHPLPYVISGLEFDGVNFWCGDCNTGSLRSVTRGGTQ